MMCNDVDNNLPTEKSTVASSWKEYFQTLLNGEEQDERNRSSITIASNGQAVESLTQGDAKKATRELKMASCWAVTWSNF